MKKLFLLIPALVISMMMSATIHEIGPGNPETVVNDLLVAKLQSSAVVDGDVIELKDGIYSEYSNYLFFDKSVEVRAAEGAHPIVEVECYIKIGEKAAGKNITIRGIKFDASKQGPTGSNDKSYSHFIRVYSAGTLDFEDCEFYGCTNQVIEVESSSSVANLIVNNCYFRNITNTCIYNQNTAASNMTITNSTFANIDATGVSAGIIDTKAATGTVVVDHCTFYDCKAKNTDYGVIGHNGSFTSDFTVSNSIFAWATMYDKRATYLPSGTSVSNCLTYNTNKDTDKWGHHSGPTFSNCMLQDPLFNDLANNKYTYDGNWVTMSISPARGTATDGTDLGDPLWYSAEVLPEVDFASDYDLLGAKAQLSGNIELNESSHIKYTGSSTPGVTTWKMHIEKACALSGVIDMEDGNTSGCTLKLIAFDADGNKVDSLVAPYTDEDENVPVAGCMYIPAEGNYTFKLYNGTGWSSSKIEKITLSYVGGETQSISGTMDVEEAWFSSRGSRADGMITFTSYTDQWVKWNAATANTKAYDVTLNINNPTEYGHRFTVAIYEDEDEAPVATFTESSWNKTYGEPLAISMGSALLQSGKNYIVKVTNAESGAQPKVISVGFAALGGGLVDIPGDITLTEAILSSRAYIDENGEIRFTNDDQAGHVTEESVAWRVNVSKAGYYKFTTSVNSNNGHSYLVSVYNADETVLKGSVPQSGDDIWGAPKTFSTDNIYLEEGEYRVKVQNTTNNSNGRIVSISASYEGGAVVNIPNVAIPFADAILSENATRNLESVPQEIHFGSPNASQYAQWNIHAVAGLYTFTFDVVGTNYGTYKLDILEGNDNIFTYTQGKEGSGQVTISKVFIPAEGDYVLQLANTNSGANGYLTSLAATAATDVFVLDENTEDDGSIEAVAATGEEYTFLIKRSFTADKYYTICLPVSSWDSELKLAFGADYELWQMSSATQSGDEITLNFEQVTSFNAGKPYIIKPSVDVVNPILYNKKEIKNYTYNNVQEFAAADFIGTFYKSEIPAGENNLYLQNNNLYYNESDATPIKGTRAWIRLKPQGGANNVKAARIVLGGKVATEISLVNGELVDGTVKTIENGQLVIIRDGVRYNVMGVKLQ